MEWIATIIAGVLGLMSGLLILFADRRRRGADADLSSAEAANLLTEAALSLVEPLNIRILELEKAHATQAASLKAMSCRIQKLERERDVLFRGAVDLTFQVLHLGAKPVFDPLKIVSDNNEGEAHERVSESTG